MKNILWRGLLVFALFFSSGDVFALDKYERKDELNEWSIYREGEVIIRYRQGTDVSLKELNLRRETSEKGLSVKNVILDERVQLVRSEDKTTEKLIQELEGDKNVEIVEPNYIRRPFGVAPDDTYFSLQWALENIGQSVAGQAGTVDADVDALDGWDDEVASPVIVAVIDSGVNYAHEDISANMWDGSSACRDEDNVDIVGGCPHHGWDFENSDNDPLDDDGHGSFVAGIIGGVTNNGRGVSGMSHSNSLKVMAIRFGYDLFSELDAIAFAENNGAKVINASYGGEGYSVLEKNAIENFPGIVVAAAGNGGDDFVGDDNDVSPQYPASYDLANVIAVASSDQNDQLSSFSNYGSDSVHIAAPGENITSLNEVGTYYYGSGTSFATPHVVALAGLIMAKQPLLTPEQIREIIFISGDALSLVEERKKIHSASRLNIDRALEMVESGLYIDGTYPIYRFWSDTKQGHFFTSSEAEKNYVITNYPENVWKYEGVAWYVPE